MDKTIFFYRREKLPYLFSRAAGVSIDTAC